LEKLADLAIMEVKNTTHTIHKRILIALFVEVFVDLYIAKNEIITNM
tara:strand:+ start:1765 stop:1905 length:141 start_codon:yes stop_codon:yes gene_type:complete